MQDLHAAPRWSKTAVLVVLVVFGLVLLVAVFGLLALTSQRERSESTAREEAFQDGRSLLEQVAREVGKRLDGALNKAAAVDAELESASDDGASRALRDFLAGGRYGPLVAHAWRVGAAGDVGWLGGHFLLWDMRPRLVARSAKESRDGARRKELTEAAFLAARSEGARVALGDWMELAASQGLAVDPPEVGRPAQPLGPGLAKLLVNAAADAAGEASLPASVARNAVLRALELISLNRILSPNAQLDLDLSEKEIDAAVERLLGHLPSEVRADLAWEVSEFRAGRDFVADGADGSLGNHVDLRAARDALKPDREREVREEGAHIFGVVRRSPHVRLVVTFDRTAVENLLEDELARHEGAFRTLGLEARRFAEEVQTPRLEGFDGRSYALPLKGRWDLPYQLAIFQTGRPRTESDTFTNVLFWVVLGLAVAGLFTGGTVLVRLLTREIRLAQLKADFVSNLSHELKTPITSMLLFTEMLEEGKLTDPQEQAEAFGVLGQESRRLRRIVTRMIDVARGEARRTPYEMAPGDLNRPVLEATARFRRIVTEPGLDLAIRLVPERLPVRMDAQAMDDAVTNLLSNAWKYKRGDRARITVRTARQGRFAEILVGDDGIGIPRADRRKVFDMFYRSEQYLTHPVPGTGLGLALVRSVVAAHRGRIDLQPGEGGVGTLFRVRVPLDRRAREAEPAADASPADEAAEAAEEAEKAMGPASHGKVEPSAAPRSDATRSGAGNPGLAP
jgi:two-component system phosphate regulon sensor histidine kinase PhoR